MSDLAFAFGNKPFDVMQVKPATGFMPVPTGNYTSMVRISKVASAKSGRGRYLSLEIEIVEGNFQGRRVWENLNLNHTNPETVEIAQRKLSQICRAMGVLSLDESAQLYNVPFQLSIQYDYQNQVRYTFNRLDSCSQQYHEVAPWVLDQG
ncbi:MAG: DUF669 domain-containing protein [Methylococcales bacterium]|jgi:hypothetical protein|nr:DUF669 domain-containing protein [Methylococcales bacterium]